MGKERRVDRTEYKGQGRSGDRDLKRQRQGNGAPPGREEARLVLAARRVELLEATARKAEDRGAPEVLAIPCDVTDREQVEAVAEATLARWGRIDAWVNNAGLIGLSLFEDTTEEEFRRMLEVNLMGAVYGAWAALPAMRRQGSGVIVNIASMASLV